MTTATPEPTPPGEERYTVLDAGVAIWRHRRHIFLASLGCSLAAFAVAFVLPPTFTSRALLLPPQQQQSMSASALSALGGLSALAGVAGLRSPGEQYVALLESRTVSDRIIEQFDLMKVYDVPLVTDARKKLASKVRIALSKKDGLLSIEVDDEDATRAARMANQYVEELKRMTGLLALTEAQQRRVFFEVQLAQTKERLVRAQQALEVSGFTAGAMKAEPKAVAEGYAKLRAEVTATEVRLQAMRRSLTDSAPEVQQQLAVLSGLRSELSKAESATSSVGGANYVSKYREFKYQETLFELMARQFELAKLDESREGALVQVVDTAMPAERRTSPKRMLTAIVAAVLAFVVLSACAALWERLHTTARGARILSRLGRKRAGSQA